jgi:hypothetical protein
MAPSDSEVDPRYAAQFQRGYVAADGDPPASGGAPAVDSREPEPELPVEREPEETPAAEATGNGPRRAIEWALPAAGIGLLAAAVVLFVTSLGFPDDGILPPNGEMLRAVANEAPGPLLLGGVLALCLWVALRVVRSGPGDL